MDLKLSKEENIKQEKYKNARTSDWYDDIWKNVGKCVFCDLKDKYILFEENEVVMTISLYPYIDGHFMIVPRQHVSSPKELSSIQWETIRKFIYLAKKMIKETKEINSLQFVYKDGISAQGTVNGHMHIHCVPFDQPDLSIWNYRKLEFTPLENVEKYKNIAKKIIKNKIKFETKYSNRTVLPIVCDLVIMNKKKEILFQERSEGNKFHPDIITLPGGHVDDLSKSLEEELCREVFEETGAKLDCTKIKLLDSRIGKMILPQKSKHLNIKYPYQMKFLWNSYFYEGEVDDSKLKAQDDAKELVWLSIDEIKSNERITKEVRELINKL